MISDTILFVEIIESVPGIQWIRDEQIDGMTVKVYQGLIGKSVRIDMSEEEISPFVGRGYLRLLGLETLGDALFPSEQLQSPPDEEKEKN